MELSLPDPTPIPVRAYLVGRRLDLRGAEWADAVAQSPLLVRAGGGYAVVFRYGAVVFFGLRKGEEEEFMAKLLPLAAEPFAVPETEETSITRTPDSGDLRVANIPMGSPSSETLQIVADVLGKSVALAFHESSIARTFQRIEPFAENLSRRASPGMRPRELLRQLGEALLAEMTMSGRVEIRDKPELLWENPQHERLHRLLALEYELADRHAIIEHKIELLSNTAETILGILQHRSSIRVEWYITVLILVEIFITLYRMNH